MVLQPQTCDRKTVYLWVCVIELAIYVIDNECSVRLLCIQTQATMMESEHNKCPRTTQRFMQEQKRNLHSRQSCSTVGLRTSGYKFNKTNVIGKPSPIDRLFKIVLVRLYQLWFYITRVTKDSFLSLWKTYVQPYVQGLYSDTLWEWSRIRACSTTLVHHKTTNQSALTSTAGISGKELIAPCRRTYIWTPPEKEKPHLILPVIPKS